MFKIRYKSHHDVKNIIDNLLKRKMATSIGFNKILNSKIGDKECGIYVHTPYCDKICSFCNMNRKQLSNNLDDYADHLCKEFKKAGERKYVQEKEISVVFFGGGTPTIYRANQLERVLSNLKENFKFSKDCEITFESTIHNLSLEKLKIMEKYGVNRISVGVQTFSDRGRKLLNRTYDKKTVIEKLKNIRNNFNGLLCIDIIYNYPGQTLEEVEEDAKILCELGLDSSSFYSLMIQEGSKIAKARNEEEILFKYSLQRDKELHDRFLEITSKNGYKVLEHTKISNGNDSYKYIDNINRAKNLLAIGTGAGGRVENIEYYNLNKMITFYSRDSELKYNMKKLSGIMQFKTVHLYEIKKLSGKHYSEVYKLLEQYKNKGLIKINDESYTYTIDGVFWGNSITAEVVKMIINLEKRK
ncbi:coproporphyrinogen-III oxidase family protein [Fusobacterium sp. MFO224]|uniref:coproporphyrinogen-III oxidase family protein n=1 Tax=Fusobacterium sp. MFO224 TaxID=3378070 RepID=UPI00385550CD